MTKKLFKKYLLGTLRYILSAFLSAVAIIVSSLVAILTRDILRGRNYSDVGVPMYSNGDLSIFVGLLAFILISLGLLHIIAYTFNRNNPWFPYVVAFIICIYIYSDSTLFLVLFW